MDELDLLAKLPLADSRYRNLAKHVARTFYAGPCPPPDWEEKQGIAAAAPSSKRKASTWLHTASPPQASRPWLCRHFSPPASLSARPLTPPTHPPDPPQQVDTTGLAIVVLDALAQYQWVKEDDLAGRLGIQQKAMRKAAVYLANVSSAAAQQPGCQAAAPRKGQGNG
jgi:hypothetical protein